MNDFRPPRERLQAVLARVSDINEGDTRGRAESAGLAIVEHEMQRPMITLAEEIAGLVLDLRWKELVDTSAEIVSEANGKLPGGTDLAPLLWAWAYKKRGRE